MTDTMIIIAASIIALTALVTFFVSRSILVSRFKMERARYDSNISLLQQRLSDADKHHEKAITLLNEGHEKAMSELKVAHNQALNQQLETLKAQMTAETEKLLKAREDELDRKAKETFGHIAEGLDKDIRSMREAFDSNRKSMVFMLSPLIFAASAIPNAADIETDVCPPPNESYSLSAIFGNPLIPLYFLLFTKASFLPVNILCAYA